MTENEILAILRLQSVRNVGGVIAKKLIAHCGSPRAIFTDKTSHLEKITGIGSSILRELSKTSYLKEAERELRYLQKEKIEIQYYEQETYPSFLKHCVDAPIVLFQKGKINLTNRKIISVVGTRNITGYGRAFCEKFISEIAPLNPVIVSGFAYGVDITVQKLAFEHGLQTIGCLAHGHNQIYPKTHIKYVSKVMEHGGFITEFWSTSNPDRENFLKRNRIIAGMSEATIVVESAEKGGSLVTADMANGYNREVFAVPGRYTDKYSKGCNDLIKRQKAQMITSAGELVYFLGWDLHQERNTDFPPDQQVLFPNLDDIEQIIYDYLVKEGKKDLDTIALSCQTPVFKVSSVLVTLEMKGLVRPLPGKAFEVI